MATERPPPASFSTLPSELKAAIVELVYLQDVARNRRITPPTPAYVSSGSESESESEGADSDDGVIVDGVTDSDGDGEDWDDEDEDSESGELSYLGRGIPALFQVDRALSECSAVYMFQAIKASMVRRPAFRSLVLPNRKNLITTIFFETRKRAYYGHNSATRTDVLSRQLAFIQTALSMAALPNLSTVVFTDELAQAYFNGQDEYHDLIMAIASSADRITTLSLLQHTAEQAAAALALFPNIQSLHLYLARRTTSLQPLLDVLSSRKGLVDLSIYPLTLVEPTRVREGPALESVPALRRLHFGGTFYGQDLSILDLLKSSSDTLEVLSIGGGDDRSPVGGDDGRGRFRPTFLEPVPSLLLHVPSNSPLPPAPRLKRTVFRHFPSLPKLRQLDVVAGSTEHLDRLLMLPVFATSPIKTLTFWIASVAPPARGSPKPPRSPSSDPTSEPFSDVIVRFISRNCSTLKLVEITSDDRQSYLEAYFTNAIALAAMHGIHLRLHGRRLKFDAKRPAQPAVTDIEVEQQAMVRIVRGLSTEPNEDGDSEVRGGATADAAGQVDEILHAAGNLATQFRIAGDQVGVRRMGRWLKGLERGLADYRD